MHTIIANLFNLEMQFKALEYSPLMKSSINLSSLLVLGLLIIMKCRHHQPFTEFFLSFLSLQHLFYLFQI